MYHIQQAEGKKNEQEKSRENQKEEKKGTERKEKNDAEREDDAVIDFVTDGSPYVIANKSFVLYSKY
jgi:hypothetical protein